MIEINYEWPHQSGVESIRTTALAFAAAWGLLDGEVVRYLQGQRSENDLLAAREDALQRIIVAVDKTAFENAPNPFRELTWRNYLAKMAAGAAAAAQPGTATAPAEDAHT